MHRVYEDLSGHRLAFIYSGSFPDEHTAGLITIGEEIAAMGGVEKGGRNKLAFVLVEAYQNIVRHRASLSKELDRTQGRCMFLVMDGVDHQDVVALDPIPLEEVAALTDQLEQLHEKGPAQLKELFIGRLKNEQRSVRGGAGLGLIEMSRRSGNALQHAFTPLDDGHAMFMLKARLGAPISEKGGQWDPHRIHDQVVALDLVLLCMGRLSPAIQEVLLHLLDKEVKHDKGRSDAMAKAYLAANVLLRSCDGPEDAPMIALRRERDDHVLVIGLTFSDTVAASFVSDLTEVTAMAPSVLQRHYRNALLGRGPGSPWMLSLLDLARTGRLPIRWSAHALHDGRLILLEVRS